MKNRWFPEHTGDRVPFLLERKRIYVLPTRLGVLFLTILAAMLAGSANYNNNLGFLLTFLLGSMAFVSIFHSWSNLTRIRIISTEMRPVFSGEMILFQLIVKAENPVRYAVMFSFSEAHQITRDIHPDKDVTIKIGIKTEKRGRFHPGPLRISTVFPFGLFRAWCVFHHTVSCIVYPKPVTGPFLPVHSGLSGTEEHGETGGSGVDDFVGLAPYREGDSLHRISWKTFSRGQGLNTKEFSGITGSTILLDWNVLKHPDPEYRLSRLCDMVLKAEKDKLIYGLDLPGKRIFPGNGITHKNRCLKELALFETSAGRK